MNRYYTETIPDDLAMALKEKGMPIETEGKNIWCPSYGECFDMFMDKGLCLSVSHEYDFAEERVTDRFVSVVEKVGYFSNQPGDVSGFYDTWYEAAEAAINKALELI